MHPPPRREPVMSRFVDGKQWKQCARAAALCQVPTEARGCPEHPPHPCVVTVHTSQPRPFGLGKQHGHARQPEPMRSPCRTPPTVGRRLAGRDVVSAAAGERTHIDCSWSARHKRYGWLQRGVQAVEAWRHTSSKGCLPVAAVRCESAARSLVTAPPNTDARCLRSSMVAFQSQKHRTQ